MTPPSRLAFAARGLVAAALLVGGAWSVAHFRRPESYDRAMIGIGVELAALGGVLAHVYLEEWRAWRGCR